MTPDPPALPAPPPGLSDSALRLWTSWIAEADEDDVDLDAREYAVLTSAVQHLTHAERLAAEVAALPALTVSAATGPRLHPAAVGLETSRRTVASLLASIKRVDRSAVNAANVSTRYRGAPR